MNLDDALAGNILEPSPPPTDHPPDTATDNNAGGWDLLGTSAPVEARPDTDDTPVPAAEEPPDETGVVASGIEPGPVQQLVTSGVESLRQDIATGAGVVRDIVTTAPRDALAVSRSALGISRAVGDTVFAGVPDVDGVAHMGARKLAGAAASIARGGFLANGWARFSKYRGRWEA